MDRCHCWEMGLCFPQDVQTNEHCPQPTLASGLCIKQHFFSDMASSTPSSLGSVRIRGDGTTSHVEALGSPALEVPLPLPPAQHTRLRKALYCAAMASAAFGTFTKEIEKGDGSTALWGQGCLAETCSSRGSGAGWAGLLGLPKQRGTPVQSHPHPSCLAVGKSWLTP